MCQHKAAIDNSAPKINLGRAFGSPASYSSYIYFSSWLKSKSDLFLFLRGTDCNEDWLADIFLDAMTLWLNPWTQTISISTTISLFASIIVRWSRRPRFCLGRIHFGLKLGTAFAPWSRATARKAREKHFSVPRPTVLHWQLLRHPLSNDNRSSVKAHKLGALYSPAVSQHHDTPTARGGKETLPPLPTQRSKTRTVAR